MWSGRREGQRTRKGRLSEREGEKGSGEERREKVGGGRREKEVGCSEDRGVGGRGRRSSEKRKERGRISR